MQAHVIIDQIVTDSLASNGHLFVIEMINTRMVQLPAAAAIEYVAACCITRTRTRKNENENEN